MIVRDLRMPGMGGAELCLRLKANAKTKSIPIVLLTGADPEEARRAQRAGAAALVRKPFSPLDLVAVVEDTVHQVAVGDLVEQLAFHDRVLSVVTLRPHQQQAVVDLMPSQPPFRLGPADLVAAGDDHDLEPFRERPNDRRDRYVQAVLTDPAPVERGTATRVQRQRAVDRLPELHVDRVERERLRLRRRNRR